MALALNNLKRVDMPSNKETTPNNFSRVSFYTYFSNGTYSEYKLVIRGSLMVIK